MKLKTVNERVRIMFCFRKGSIVPFPEKIHEKFAVFERFIIANIGADKIEGLLTDFIKMQDEPLFFILELPSKQEDENETEPGKVSVLHKDVYYIDGCSAEDASEIFGEVGNILVNDGLSSFGFGCHFSHDEIMIGKYNVLTICSNNPVKYVSLLKKHNIEQVSEIVTAPNTFTSDNPGISERIATGGKDIFDIPVILRDKGIYFAEQRED